MMLYSLQTHVRTPETCSHSRNMFGFRISDRIDFGTHPRESFARTPKSKHNAKMIVECEHAQRVRTCSGVNTCFRCRFRLATNKITHLILYYLNVW